MPDWFENTDRVEAGWVKAAPVGQEIILDLGDPRSVAEEIVRRQSAAAWPPTRDLNRGATARMLKQANKQRAAEALPPLPPPDPPMLPPPPLPDPQEGAAVDAETAETLGSPGQADIAVYIALLPGLGMDLDDVQPEDWDHSQDTPDDELRGRLVNAPVSDAELGNLLARVRRNRPLPGQKDPTHLETRPTQPASAADPVELATGAFVLQATDLAVPSPHLPIRFVRSYRSGRPYDGPFGFAWDHNFNVYLRRLKTGQLALWAGSLRELYFKPEGASWAGERAAADIQELPAGSDEFVVRWRGGLRWRMARPVGWSDGERIPLREIVDRVGRRLTLDYDGKDRLSAVSDPQGRGLRLAYGECNLLERVSDHTGGRAVHYLHRDDVELLDRVRLPPTAAFPQGAVTRFEYDLTAAVTSMRFNLLRFFDTFDRLFLENRYAAPGESWASNAVVWQRTGDDEFRFEYEHVQYVPDDPVFLDTPVSRTRVLGPDGALNEYSFNLHGDVVDHRMRLSHDGTYRVVSAQARYDAAGHCLMRIRPDGSRTVFHYETTASNRRARSNVVGVEEVSALPGLGASRRTVCTVQYEALCQLPRTITSESGAITRFDYDVGPGPEPVVRLALLTVPAVVRPDGSAEPDTETYAYDGAGRLSETVSPAGVPTRYGYVAGGLHDGFLSDVTVGDGMQAHTRAFGYDTWGFPASVEEGPGRRFDLTANALGQLERLQLPSIEGRRPEVRQWFDEAGGLMRRESPAGEDAAKPLSDVFVETFETDLLGRPVRRTDGDGSADARTWHYRVDAAGRLAQVWTPEGRTERFEHDERGLVIRRIAGDGADAVAWRFTYDRCGRLARAVAPDGAITHYDYDRWGRPSRIRRPEGAATAFVWGVEDRLEACVELDGLNAQVGYDRELRRVEFGQDARGQVVSETVHADFPGQPGVALTARYEYDGDGRRTAATNAYGVRTTAHYDTAGRPDQTLDEFGSRRAWRYDALGQVSEAELRLAGLAPTFSTFGYDSWGRLAAWTEPQGATTWRWDDAGRLREERRDGLEVRRFAYSLHGELRITVVAPGTLSLAHRLDYDADGLLTAYDDPTGARTRLDRDGLGRVRRLTSPGGGRWTFDFDPAAGEAVRHAPSGARVRQRLTRAGGRTLEITVTPGPGQLPVDPGILRFDGLGRVVEARATGEVITRAYDSLDRLRRETARGESIAVDYDDIARMQILTYPDGAQERSTHDMHGRPVSLAARDGATWSDVATFSYGPAGRADGLSFPGGVQVTFGHDEAGRLVETVAAAAGATLDGWRIAYDARDHRALLQRLGPEEGAELHLFDAAGRLSDHVTGFAAPLLPTSPSVTVRAAAAAAAAAVAPTAPERTLYVLNGADGRLRQDRTSAGAVTTTLYGLAADHRPTTVGTEVLDYDADGARLADADFTYTWDGLGRLRRVHDRASGGLVQSLEYDVLQRNASGIAQGQTYERWFLENHRLVDRRPGAADLRTTPRAGGGPPLRAWQGAISRLLLCDDHRSSSATFAAGATTYTAYDPFGVALTPDGEVLPQGLSFWRGMPRLEGTPHYLAGARVYDSQHGAFLSPDPLLYVDSPNRYAFAGQNPADFADPGGLAKEPAGISEPPVQTVAETVIVGEPPFQPEVSDPRALAAAKGMGHIELGDVAQFFKGLYNGGVNALPVLSGPVIWPLVLAAEIPKAEIDPRFGGAGIMGEQLGENLAFEAVGLVSAAVNGMGRMRSSRRLAETVTMPVFWMMGAGGPGGGSLRALSSTRRLATPGRAVIPLTDLGQVGLITGKRTFRRFVTAAISDVKHPLHGLLNPATRRLRPSTTKGLTELHWFEDPRIVEAGHWSSAKDLRGVPDKLIIMSAYENRLAAAVIEHPRIGGIVAESGHVVAIGGLPIDLRTAEALVEFGVLSAEVLAEAPFVLF